LLAAICGSLELFACFQTQQWRGTHLWPNVIPSWKTTVGRNTDWNFR